jgi:isovaleryl-CoA dehydrogenase
MLFVNNVARNCSHEQKLKYLPSACSGEKIGGMGMSEPSVGTDVLGLSSFAKPSADGSYYTLNGTKMWITNGTITGKDTGDFFLVYAKTDAKAKNGALTSFIVEKGMPGFELGQKITDKCGMRASNTAELVFADVKIPKENIVGEVGGAMLCMMRNLEIERIVLAAMSLGIARRSIEVMSRYSQERKAFGKPIGDYGQVSFICSYITTLSSPHLTLALPYFALDPKGYC